MHRGSRHAARSSRPSRCHRALRALLPSRPLRQRRAHHLQAQPHRVASLQCRHPPLQVQRSDGDPHQPSRLEYHSHSRRCSSRSPESMDHLLSLAHEPAISRTCMVAPARAWRGRCRQARARRAQWSRSGACPVAERGLAVGGTDRRDGRRSNRDIWLCRAAFAGREKDWLDIEGIVARQGSVLDRRTIWNELLPLLELKEDTSTEPRLRRVLESDV